MRQPTQGRGALWLGLAGVVVVTGVLVWVATPVAGPDVRPAVQTRDNAGGGSVPRTGLRPGGEVESQARRMGPVLAPDALRGGEAEGAESPAAESGDAIPHEYVWRFFNGVDREAFVRHAREVGIEILDESAFGQAVRIRAPRTADLARLRRDGPTPLGEERNYRIAPPDDVSLDKRPAESGYRPFLDKALAWLGVSSPDADSGRGVTVAVLDTAVARHPALNEGRVLRVGRGAGRVDGALAHHGTAVASLIGGNGYAGISGPAPGARLVTIPVMSGAGTGDSFTLAQAIVQAVTLNADIINLSLGTTGDSPLLREAIAHAQANDVVVVAAVGNEGVDAVAYPARYPGVLAVGGVEADARHVFFSNRGPAVDLVAPAYGVQAAGADAQSIAFSGTSAAAPLVSGALAALMADDRRLSGQDAAAILLKTADDAGRPGSDAEYGAGVLNLARAFEHRRPGVIDMVAVPPVVVQEPGGETVLYVYAQNRGTETVGEVRFSVEVDGMARERTVRDLAPGDRVQEEFAIDMTGQTGPRSVALRFRAEILSGTDRTPENNARGAVLTVHPVPHD